MRPSILIQAWTIAAQDLSIEIVVPFVLKLENGEEVQADLPVKDSGPTLVATKATEDVFHRLGDQTAAKGYGTSVFFGEEFVYNREHFIEILKDFGWVGAEDRRPEWRK